MEYGNLSRANKRIYNRAIVRTHQRRIELHILTLDGRFVRSLTPKITGGTITTDVEQTPMQVCDVTFVDRTRSLVFEPDDTAIAPLHRKFMVRVIDSRRIGGLGWIDCTVFTGPIWTFKRVGAEVTLTAHSVDRLAMGSVRRAKSWLRKSRKTTVMKELLGEAGLTHLRIPNLKATTPVHVHIGHTHPKKKGEKPHKTRKVTGFNATSQDTYWDKASALADSMNRLLYPTTDGTAALRSHPQRPVYHFDRALVDDVDLERSANEGPNTFIVVGAKPKGSKRRVSSGKIGFPRSNPLSAGELAVNNKPYEILERTHNPHFKTRAECRKVAIRKRDHAARVTAAATIDALPIPWLRPWDLVTAAARWGVPAVHIEQMTYPLSPDNTPMTIGAVRQGIPQAWRRRAS